jgi:hypothetical protein
MSRIAGKLVRQTYAFPFGANAKPTIMALAFSYFDSRPELEGLTSYFHFPSSRA